ncbi:replication initiation negative regulator SeqA [Aestuariibacter salexigens]|uniref:replication initiation negative regulator SeqA n=1 Tax=Aestuariibacter salexigens TaxID=226010 RepID=UPI00041C45D1|nr:replication initiation negative regulator SeqA [Aestuariibacter salexigens]
MKTIDIDDDLYQYIASQTQFIGESASDILRRLLKQDLASQTSEVTSDDNVTYTRVAEPTAPVAVIDDISQVLNEQTLSQFGTVVERFLFVLSTLALHHREHFNHVLDIKGSDRLYFATSKDALLASGSSTNPKAIPDTDYWVVTNNNTNKKKTILKQVLLSLGYAEEKIGYIADLLVPNKTA